MHATVLVDPAREAELDAAEAAGEQLFELVVRMGGSVAGEHGVGWLKRGRLEGQWPPAAVELHEAIKRTFDPKGLLNPGKKLARYSAASLLTTHQKGSSLMNKSQLIDAVASDSGLPKADTVGRSESLLDTVTKTLKKGDEVAITGFGKFSVVKRAARQGVNPRTGERVKIKASKAPKFSAGAS